MIEDLHGLLVSADLSRVADVIVREARSSVRIWALAAEDEDSLPIGISKIGGSPDLPPDCEWPTHDGYPLAFVAQINLADVAPYDVERVLPETGVLSFFYDYDGIFRGRDESRTDLRRLLDDPANWRVYAFEGDLSVLERTPTPTMRQGIEATGPFRPCTVKFEHSTTILDVLIAEERFSFSSDEWDAYHKIQMQLWHTDGESCSRMLGLPDALQVDRTYLQDGEILLLQLGSERDAGMMWGDGGNLYFIIGADALARRDFSAVRFALESG